MRYNKPALSIREQIHLLESRGLIIPDQANARHYLNNISYYRLRAYWLTLENRRSPEHSFLPNTNFQNILDLYIFDRKLRLLIFDELERIEIAFRTQIIHQYSIRYEGMWYLDQNHFRTHSHFLAFKNRILEEYRRSSETFITHYKNTYTEPPFPPAWVMLELASLGMLSKVYKNLKTTDEKKKIAKYFGLHFRVLESWLEALTSLRNFIAHHGRIWNRKFVISPIYPRDTDFQWITTIIGENHLNKLYLQLCCIRYLLHKVNPSSTFSTKLKNHIERNPMIRIHYMGFPPNWDNDDFWQ